MNGQVDFWNGFFADPPVQANDPPLLIFFIAIQFLRGSHISIRFCVLERRSKNLAAGKPGMPAPGGCRNRILIGNSAKLYALIGTKSFLSSPLLFRKLNFIALMEFFSFGTGRPEAPPLAIRRPGL